MPKGQAAEELELSRGLRAALLYLVPLLHQRGQLTAVTAGYSDMPSGVSGLWREEQDIFSENSSSTVEAQLLSLP